MKLSVRRDQPRGGGHPQVATPLMHELVEKKVKSENIYWTKIVHRDILLESIWISLSIEDTEAFKHY